MELQRRGERGGQRRGALCTSEAIIGAAISFNVEMLKEGIRRRVNDFPDDVLCASSAVSAPPR